MSVRVLPHASVAGRPAGRTAPGDDPAAPAHGGRRRIRDDARDGLAAAAVSLGGSIAVTLALAPAAPVAGMSYAAPPPAGDAGRDRRAAGPRAGRARAGPGRRHPRARRSRRGPAPAPARRPAWSGSTAIPQALALAAERLAPFGDRVTLVEAVYDELPEVLARLGRPRVQGILLDLGLSSLQIDDPERGFAYAYDAPLDMRMGRQELTAAEVLNTYAQGRPGPDPAQLRRGAVRRPDRRADRRRAGPGAVHDLRPAGAAAQRRGADEVAAQRRAPGQADLPGAADRGERRAGGPGVGAARARSPPWPSAAGSPCWRTTRSRTGWSSSCWPRVLGTAPRGTCRSCRPSWPRSCGC